MLRKLMRAIQPFGRTNCKVVDDDIRSQHVSRSTERNQMMKSELDIAEGEQSLFGTIDGREFEIHAVDKQRQTCFWAWTDDPLNQKESYIYNQWIDSDLMYPLTGMEPSAECRAAFGEYVEATLLDGRADFFKTMERR